MSELRGSFEAEGYTVLRGLFNAGEVSLLRDMSANLPEYRQERGTHTLAGFDAASAELDLLSRHPSRIDRVKRTVGAESLRWISGYHIDKGPHSSGLEWHQDWWAWDHRMSYSRLAVQVALLCYLQPTTTRNGALRVLPGSHLARPYSIDDLPDAHDPRSDQLSRDNPAMRAYDGEVTVECDAGDAVIFDYRLLHSTHPNHAAQARKAVHWSFTPNWNEVPADLQSHLSQHPCLQVDESALSSRVRDILPRYSGDVHYVEVNRRPHVFVATS